MIAEAVEPGTVETVVEVAELFGVSTQSIQKWLKHGLPRRGDGSFHMPACIRWRVDQLAEKAKPRAADGSTKLELELRKLKADSEAKELVVERARGDFFEAHLVERLFRERLSYLTEGLRVLPHVLDHDCADRKKGEIAPVVQERVDAMLRGFAEDIMPLLQERRRLLKGGHTMKKGRGRPRKG